MLPLDFSRDVFVQRCSLDNGRVDSHGVIFLDLCKQTGLRIFNGRCDNDKRGNYTHVGSQGSSVVSRLCNCYTDFNGKCFNFSSRTKYFIRPLHY